MEEKVSGSKIIDGLKDAIAGNFARVTIGGQVWVRRDAELERIARWHIRMAKLAEKSAANMTKRGPRSRMSEQRYWHMNVAQYVRSLKL